MSYCRWSSDQFQCDVYVYEDCSGGWTTHVAGRRSKWKSPKFPWRAHGKWYWSVVWRWYSVRNRLWSRFRTLHDIGLKYDGDSFNHDTPSECAEHLIHLRVTGYNVPQYAIESLFEEQVELETSTEGQT